MKRVITGLYVYILCCLLMSCTHHIADSHSYGVQVRPTQNLNNPQNLQEEKSISWMSLLNHSMKARTIGSEGNLQVMVQNLSDSFQDEPLFVVDDITMGKGWMMVSSIDANTIQRIEILNRPNQTADYGQLGRHGVILIQTTKLGTE